MTRFNRSTLAFAALALIGTAPVQAQQSRDAARAHERAERADALHQVTSANAYLDAALVAIQRKRRDDAVALIARAEQLTASPFLTVDQRSLVLRRLAPAALAATRAED